MGKQFCEKTRIECIQGGKRFVQKGICVGIVGMKECAVFIAQGIMPREEACVPEARFGVGSDVRNMAKSTGKHKAV